MANCYYNYLSNLSPMRAGQVRKQLDKRIRYEGEVKTNSRFVAGLVAKGARPDQTDGVTTAYGSRWNHKESKPRTEYRLSLDNGQCVVISKIEHSFACYLIENGGATPYDQMLLQVKEQARLDAERIEAEVKKAQAKEEQRKKDNFKEWLNAEALNYLNDPRLKVMEDIFMRDHGRFYPVRQGAFIVLIDNIDNPLARAKLISWLNQMNKTSKKVFHAVTGIKLPKTDKGTRQILETLTSAEIRRNAQL